MAQNKHLKTFISHDSLTSLEEKNILNYWDYDYEKKSFRYRIDEITQKSNLSQSELNSLVRNNSTLLATVTCKKCVAQEEQQFISRHAFIKSGIRVVGGKNLFTCNTCLLVAKEELENQKLVLKNEMLHITREAIHQNEHNKLSGFEFKILKNVCDHSDYLKTFQYYANKGLHQQFVEVIDKLEEVNLLHLNTEHSKEYFREIILWPEFINLILSLESRLEMSTSKFAVNYKSDEVLGFSFYLNSDRKSMNSPNFVSLFEVSEDITLKKGSRFVAGGWINESGGVNVSIDQSTNFKGPSQEIPDRLPKSARDIIRIHFKNLK